MKKLLLPITSLIVLFIASCSGGGVSVTAFSPTGEVEEYTTFEVEFSAISDKGCLSEGDGTGDVIVYPRPVADFAITPDELTTDESEIQGENLSEEAASIDWNISDGASYDGTSFSHSFLEWGTYQVEQIVANIYGCLDTLIKDVYVEPVVMLEAPTAFTPNTSGGTSGMFDPAAMNNDIFYLISAYVETFHLVIYNRWGETVFETFDPNEGWTGYYKGELAPMSTYAWRADVIFVDGRETTQTGHVTLLK